MMLERRCSNLCKCCEDLQKYKQRVREVINDLEKTLKNEDGCNIVDWSVVRIMLGLEDE